MDRFYKALRKVDSQIVLHFDLERQRWIVLRMPEKYGRPARDYPHGEVKYHTSAGNLLEIFVCQNAAGMPMSPSWWILDYLHQRDARRINFRQYVREMDERNRKRGERIEEERRDRLDYQTKANWNHLRDELRGELGFRRYVVPVEKPHVDTSDPS